MVQKLTLKPGERIAVNGAVMVSGQDGAELAIENNARILREDDFVLPEEALTPARQLYLPIQLMYFAPKAAASFQGEFEQRVTDFIKNCVSQQDLDICARVAGDVASGKYYLALRRCRQLIEREDQAAENAA